MKLSYRHREQVWGWLAGLVVLGVATTLMWAGVVDMGGRDREDHLEAKPEQIVQLEPDKYLLPDGTRGVTADTICNGTVDGGSAVEDTTYIEDFEGTLVECVKGQSWATAKPESPNYAEGLERVVTNPVYLAIVGGPLLLWLLLSTRLGVVDARALRTADRKIQMGLDQERKELMRSWTQNEIDDTTYHLRMDALYKRGLIPADD